MSTPLEIVVTGDVSGARSALQSIQGELGRTATSSKSAASQFEMMNAKMLNFKRAASQSLNPELVTIYNRRVQELQASMNQLAGAADTQAAATFKAETATAAMGVAVNNTSVGATRLRNAIARSTDPLQIAAREINNFSRRLLYMAGASVMQLAIQGFQLILPYIIKFITGLDNMSYSARLAAANMKNINEVMQEAAKDAGKQISDLQVLYAAATNVNLSMKDRLAAVKALQDEYPTSFGNTNKEIILNGKAKDSYDALTKSIIASSMAKAGNKKLEGLAGQYIEQEQLLQKINNFYERKTKAAYLQGDKVNYSSNAGQGITPGISGQTLQTTLTAIMQQKNAAIAAVLSSENMIDDQRKSIIDIIGGGELAASLETKIKTPKTKKGVKGKDQYTLDLASLEDYYKLVQAQRVKDFDANLTDTKKNTTAVNDILLSDEMDFLEKKLELEKKYGKASGDAQLALAKTNQKKLENQQAFTQDQLNTLPKVQTAQALNLKSTTEKIDPQVYYKVSAAIEKNIKDQAAMNQLLTNTGILLDKYLGPAFDALFTSILEGSGNAFKKFSEAIKQMLVQLGAAILKAALFAAILSVISGGASGIAGTKGGMSFAQEFGKIFHLAKGGEVKGYAGGGSISGPGTSTSDSIHAMLSKGEYVMNAASVSKFGSSFFDNLNNGLLPRFSGGGPVSGGMPSASQNSVFIPSLVIKGQDLLISFNRATARASRNG